MAEVSTTIKTKHVPKPITPKPQPIIGPPRNVSPLIRFSRYSLLVAGFLYGSWRFKNLEKKERAIQEREMPIKHLMKKRAEEKDEAAKIQQMIDLAKEAGVEAKASS